MGYRGHTITESTTLVTEECCNCGVLFAITADMQDRLVQSHAQFYCPNGHGQSYTGKTEAQKQRERAERAEEGKAYLRAQLDQAQAEAEHQRQRAAGYKGAMAKAKRRSAKGMCPVPGCRRHFVNVQSHVERQHPDFIHEEPEA